MKASRLLRGRFSSLTFALACGLGSFGLSAGAAEPETVRVLSFNIWVGGEAGKQPLERTVEVIKASGADVVGLQETLGAATGDGSRPNRVGEIARLLGWNCLTQENGTAVVSRFEIVGSTPGKWGVELALPSGRRLYAFNVHLAASPYQPYHLLGIPGRKPPTFTTEAEAIRSAEGARGGQVASMLAELKPVLVAGYPAVVTGDFNEPSRWDWTEAAARAGIHPLKVEWPATRAVEECGLVDAYRVAHPDAMAFPGITWTPTTRADDPDDHHDRIDFVFVGGIDRPESAVRSVRIVGESARMADVVVDPYPSDHRAVVAELEIVGRAPAKAD